MILSSCRKTPHRAQALARQLLFLSLLSALLPQISGAYTIIFATGPITIGAGNPDNAEADFDWNPSSHQVTITLINKQLDPKGIASAISGIEIDFANLSGNATASITSTGVTTFTINTDGSVTGAQNVTSNAWLAETFISDPTATFGSSTVALCVVCSGGINGTSPPTQLVVGGPATNKPSPYGYADGNNSITNNHSPYILGSGSTFAYGAGTPLAGADTTPSWVLSIPQLQANTTIKAVRFYFGSAYVVPAQEADATIEIAPEPGAVAMVIGGLVLIAAGTWKRKRSAGSR